MERLLAELRPASVVAFGDDSSDADAFAVLRRRGDAGGIDGLAVGVTGPHGMPDDVRAAADVMLDTPFEAARMARVDRPARGPRRRTGPDPRRLP